MGLLFDIIVFIGRVKRDGQDCARLHVMRLGKLEHTLREHTDAVI